MECFTEVDDDNHKCSHLSVRQVTRVVVWKYYLFVPYQSLFFNKPKFLTHQHLTPQLVGESSCLRSWHNQHQGGRC